MNILSRTEFRRSTLLLALILISGCLLIPGALAVTISTGTFQIDTVGNTTTIPIVMDEAPNGLAGYGLVVDLSPAGVANVIDFTPPSWLTANRFMYNPTDIPGNHVGITIVDLIMNGTVKPTDRNIVLGTLTVKGISVGSAAIRITANEVDGSQGNRYSVTTPAGQLTVGIPVTTPTVTATPTVNVTTPTVTPTPTVNVTTPTVTPTPTVTVTTPTVTPTPGVLIADFLVVTTPGSNLVKITDTSVNATSVLYDLGDGTTTTYTNFRYTYWQPGTYTITLTATNALGSSVKTVQVTVGGAPTTTTTTTVTPTPTVTVTPGYPVPDFTLTTPTSMGIQIMDASVNATSVRYDLGDGTTTTYRNFRYIYWQPGTYTITLTATNAMGSLVKTVQVTVPATPATTATTPTATVTSTVTATPGGQQPYNGPHNAPGLVQAEDYDLGGEGVAYHDTTAGNTGGAYRTDDVDIEAGASGFAVAYVISDEYLTYSVDAAAAGDYPITLSAANPDAAAQTMTVSTGSSSTTVSVSSTGSFDTYKTFTSAGTLSLAAGRNVVKVAFGASRMNLDSITFGNGAQPTPTVTTTTTAQPTGIPLSTPYYMISMVPGHVESYSYDNGGEGVAYHDTTTANLGGKLRSDAVDIEYSQADAGYNIGYIIGDEWLIYSVQIDTTGTYTAAIRASNPDSTDKHIVLSLDGSSTPLATLAVPSTGSFDKYQTFTTTVQMPAGRHWLKLSFPESRMNVRFMDFTRGASTGIPDQGVPTTTLAETAAPTQPLVTEAVTTAVTTTPVATTPVAAAAAQNNTTVKA